MKDGKFKDLILEAYSKSKEGNLVGILYGAIQTYGFTDLMNIEEFVKVSNPDMFYLKSKLTNVSVDIYSFELEDFKVKHRDNTIYIKLKNKPEVAIMY